MLKNLFFLIIFFNPIFGKETVGIYWGAFDPLTCAHEAVIETSIQNLEIEKLVIVVNNHRYKNYTFPLEERIQHLEKFINLKGLKNIEIIFQDDERPANFDNLSNRYLKPLSAIAGYDAYLSWIKCSLEQERALYQSIYVVPRGDEVPVLFDSNASLLPICDSLKQISSSSLKSVKL